MSKISVIIPVYNVEKYLVRCLDSVVNQTYKNLEIIIIDDGSTDSCSNICDLYKRRDDRIVVVHKNNEGVSAARNTGLDIASGDYVAFVDSDDYIDLDMYEKLMELSIKYNADIVECECRAGRSHSFSVKGKNTKTIEIYNNIQALETFYFGDQINGLMNMVWDKLYKKELFNSIRFINGCNRGEDANITPKLFYQSKRIIKYNYNYYNYCIESPESSSLSGFDLENYKSIYLKEDLLAFFKQKKLFKFYNYVQSLYLNDLFENYYQCMVRKNNDVYKSAAEELKVKISEVISMVGENRYCGKTLKIKSVLFNISPAIYMIITYSVKKVKRLLK